MALAGLITVALSMVTLGILAGPMSAGLIWITLTLYDRKEAIPIPGDVFKGFNYFFPAFVYVFGTMVGVFILAFVLGLIPGLGRILSPAVGWVAQTFLMFGPFLIVDRNSDFLSAAMDSIDMVKKNFFNFLILAILTSILGGFGALFCGIGAGLTLPIGICILTVAFRDIFGGGTTDLSA